jgi:hypothetical protein
MVAEYLRRHVVFSVIPEAAKRLSGIHTPQSGLWIPGSRLSARPGMTDRFVES